LRQPLHSIWESAALELLRRISGDEGWTAAHDADDAGTSSPVEVAGHWELSGALNGKMQIRMNRAAAHAWAHLRPVAAGAEIEGGVLNEPEIESLTAVLEELAAAAAAKLCAGGWGPVRIAVRHVGPLRRTIEEGDCEFPLRFRHPERGDLELGIGMEASLRDQFRQGPRFTDDGDAAEPAARPGVRLDLLLDISLDVTLRFGGRQMLLHDVLDLAPGSVLELDRDIDDPVELLVGGKVIAWGDVVVVDGNYGLRISRLARKRERIAALGVNVDQDKTGADEVRA
jgi:flagellar motor switch protein FliN/FliY